MEEEYLYFILNNSIKAGAKFRNKLPVISKVKKSKWPKNTSFTDRNEGEGPFESLLALKSKSHILAGIKSQKDRQKILKSSNIMVMKDFIHTKEHESYTIDHMSAFAHITIGKITNSKVKGVHFYNPNTVRIIKKTYIDPRTKCYSAKIEKINEHNGQWIEKETESTFFPDEWDLNKLFHEYNYAFSNKQFISGNEYHAMTSNNIKIKFIINQVEKILTCYPIIEME